MNRKERASLDAFRTRLASITEEDIAWFSGWLCADGSIKPGSGWASSIVFTICDRDPLDRFAEMFGNSVYGPFEPTGFGTRPRYQWKVSGAKAIALLERCSPWLSSRYKERARQAAESYSVNSHGGRKISPGDAAAIKEALATGRHGVGRALARQYGVSDGLISAIKCGRLWA